MHGIDLAGATAPLRRMVLHAGDPSCDSLTVREVLVRPGLFLPGGGKVSAVSVRGSSKRDFPGYSRGRRRLR